MDSISKPHDSIYTRILLQKSASKHKFIRRPPIISKRPCFAWLSRWHSNKKETFPSRQEPYQAKERPNGNLSPTPFLYCHKKFKHFRYLNVYTNEHINTYIWINMS